MIVPDFIPDSVDDEVLNPSGVLAQELITISTQPNISQYLSLKAGSCSFYPTSYISHQLSQSVPLPSPAPSSTPSHQLLSMLTGRNRLPSSEQIQSSPSSVISSVCRYFHENPQCHLRVLFEKLLTSPPQSMLSSNSTLFLLNPQHSELCFITLGATPSDYRYESLFVSVEKQIEWTEWLTTIHGVTVIDGKFLYDHQRKIRIFLCSDIAIMNGTNLLFSSDHTLHQRQELLGVWLFGSPFDENILESTQFVLHLDGT